MPYIFDCNQCATLCDGNSLGVYNFMNDVQYSEHFENMLIDQINQMGRYAFKTERHQYPDIEVYDRPDGKLLCFIEVKAQRRTFMSIARFLPKSNLCPSETVALNQSDLEHYIAQSKNENVPFYLLWVLSNRPCILGNESEALFYNNLNVLQQIFAREGENRRFRRRSGAGDVVNGQHLGVTVNYHFSLNELLPLDLTKILEL